jgi:hypothetical protein
MLYQKKSSYSLIRLRLLKAPSSENESIWCERYNKIVKDA